MSSALPAGSASADFVMRARDQYRLLKIGVLAMLALACAGAFSLNLVDPDLWGHVKYAQDWMAAGEMPRTATHTYTAEGYPWVNHENLAELAFAWGVAHLGIHVMLVLKCAVGMAIVATMVSTAKRHGVPTLSAWALMVLVAANFQAFFPMRPQLFSFALCTAALVCLDRAFFGWPESRVVRLGWLCPLPLLFVAWVNSHGGFVAGLAIVGVYLLGRMVELCRDAYSSHSEVRRRILRGDTLNEQSTEGGCKPDPAAALRVTGDFWKTQIGIAAIGLLCVAATFVNPYGVGMHEWLWHSWAGAPPEITEWAPPSYGKPVFWPLVGLLLVTVACLIGTRRRRDWTHIVILALVAWQACSHLRHIAFLAMLVGFWMPAHWHSALVRLRPDSEKKLPVMLLGRRLSAALAVVMLACISLQSYTLSLRLSDFPVLRSQYPVDAFQYMVDHKLSGKAVIAFNWAQYAIAALAPEVTVQFDGRFDTCYPQEVIDMHFDWLLGVQTGPRERSSASGPVDGAKVLEYGQPDLVVLERKYPNPVAVMKAAAAVDKPEWVLLYSDSVAEIWGRRARYDDPASPHYLAPELRQLDVKLLEARWQWPALPDRSLWEEAKTEKAQRSDGEGQHLTGL